MKSVSPGSLAYLNGDSVVVLELKGFSEAIVRSVETDETSIARISDLRSKHSLEHIEKSDNRHLVSQDADWQSAVERFEIISPLLDMHTRTAEDVRKLAKENGKGITTIYRWIRAYEKTGLVSSLLRKERSDKGALKIDAEVEEVIIAKIEQIFLVPERPSVLKLYKEIKSECFNLDLPIPDKNTIYARVSAIEEKEALKRRLGSKAAKQAYRPILGKFPGADYPNAVVQVDHTPVDLIIVDDLHRQPIGKPFLTITIDVATRMISGFCLTLEHPSAHSAGLCIAHAIATKDNWLANRNIDIEWPIHGKMRKIHVDNAKEFRGNMLRRACQQHGIILEFRPRGMPNFGPHVERVFRTFMSEVHTIPGTTFSSVKDKLDYNSEGKACMTLRELEMWFTVFIVYYYHHKPHRGIADIPPIKKYEELIFGNSSTPGIGMPLPIEDEETLRLDFTPYVERSVQRQGVVIDNIHYFSHVLKKWINSKDKNKKARKYIFARDPRDISIVYFFDPDTHKYVPIPYLDSTRPSISLWELREVQRSLKDEHNAMISEDVIFQGIAKMREIEAVSIEKTRLAKQQRASEKRKRRFVQRRSNWNEAQNNAETVEVTEVISEVAGDYSDEDIQPFTDVDIS
ncbi:DDE-type integrase/transposase/recombinase [Gilvimarinus sp. SDUM040013]|uniref:DDE-type integrase/transposase/recombinase n=1 Tax=Gilvimarinus gilvus TaxID=3058038 RepID=A0ABU4S1F2_9GAMM|nr:Mu transposase C-terminal domain-containing protein [Gilvimarinus sp. SDUM040013]MDO3388114.1 DDE-type integrase/transposase/recombinase [Gilvimarinus sp. SDUM040013]MDX6850311.1 DDE-type integrase/transposase/recombinase [Gilvimarinus sp. SDUM040013]